MPPASSDFADIYISSMVDVIGWSSGNGKQVVVTNARLVFHRVVRNVNMPDKPGQGETSDVYMTNLGKEERFHVAYIVKTDLWQGTI